MRVFRSVLAVGVLALLAAPARAQEKFATAELRAGYGVTLGDAKDSLQASTIFGAGAAIAVTQRLKLGFSVDFGSHESKPLVDPLREWRVFHAFLRLAYNIVDVPQWTVGINAGPGIMGFSPNDEIRNAEGIGSEVHFAANVGGTITYWFTERIGLLLSPQLNIAFKKSTGNIFFDKSGMFAPMTGGLQFKI